MLNEFSCVLDDADCRDWNRAWNLDWNRQGLMSGDVDFEFNCRFRLVKSIKYRSTISISATEATNSLLSIGSPALSRHMRLRTVDLLKTVEIVQLSRLVRCKKSVILSKWIVKNIDTLYSYKIDVGRRDCTEYEAWNRENRQRNKWNVILGTVQRMKHCTGH